MSSPPLSHNGVLFQQQKGWPHRPIDYNYRRNYSEPYVHCGQAGDQIEYVFCKAGQRNFGQTLQFSCWGRQLHGSLGGIGSISYRK